MKEDRLESALFALLVVVTGTGLATTFDLTGRLLRFLYGEWPIICVWLVVPAYLIFVAVLHHEYCQLLQSFKTELEKKIVACTREADGTTVDFKDARKQYDSLREHIKQYWAVCWRTMDKVDELLKQKSGTVIEQKVGHVQVDQSVSAAIQDVLGDNS